MSSLPGIIGAKKNVRNNDGGTSY